MTAPTPPERVCRRCGARDNLRVIIDVLGATYKSWECRGGCPAIHHPDQPDRIDEYSTDLPDVARAARRVRAWICEWGDGLIQVTNKRPLYARDLEALVRAAAEARAELDQWRAAYGESALPGALNLMKQRTRERDEARAEADRLRSLVAELYDDGPCQYDHHDQCQGHNLDRRPCPHARAAELLTAVDALGPDAPVEPVAAHVQADPDLPPATERALGNLVRAAAADAPVEPAIQDRIERSSLGTPDAREMRGRTPDAVAQAIVSRAAALGNDSGGDEQPEIDFAGFAAVYCARCWPSIVISAADLERHNAELHPDGGDPR